ncbi:MULTISPECIES: hypothetical protein [Vibrio]|uniref:hypothetical protein n=1 Tax=Vibrio TaxID=662 RepID=UPI002075E8F0|nr:MULTISPECIES: hypothetical protein [Vibrio]USD33557.1 hypothetical protein J8Z27_05475 [Vibrio sp. SCSIO 43186]USD46625.1 hypothetical protein J4N38_05650 [Vibrio sp. SCSIO 43145]USD70681.1 hypothetical protein J4N41_05475 [Vibrio sp. SCSIO 43139]USD95599.1 hypothetical protein CTT30_05560 [Vibrio coralliilyticus]
MRKHNKIILLTVLAPVNAFAAINMAEVNAYAYEGLAEICANSRHIIGSELKEIKIIYLKKKRSRQALFPADPNFAHYAAKQLWDIGVSDNPSYDECVALLRK